MAAPTARDLEDDKDVFLPLVMKERVTLPAKLQNRHMKDSIATVLAGKVEGRCTRYGYIRPTSVDVLAISDGVLDTSQMNGSAVFEVTFRADVCNPPVGAHVRCRVENVNNYGLIAVNMSEYRVLEVIVPKDIADAGGVDISKIQAGSVVVVSVEKRRYDLHQSTITIIGRVIEYDPSKDIKALPLVGPMSDSASELGRDSSEEEGESASEDEEALTDADEDETAVSEAIDEVVDEAIDEDDSEEEQEVTDVEESDESDVE